MYRATVLLTFIAFIVSTSALKIPGQCAEDRDVVLKFDLSSYLGVWYEQERYEQDFQIDFDCVTASYSLNDNSTVKVLNENLLINGRFNPTSIEGWAIETDPDDDNAPAKLNVTFNNNADRTNYQVLATDYKTYSLVWSCFNVDEDTKDESMWVLSRMPVLDPRPVKIERLIDDYFDRNLIRQTIKGQKCFDLIPIIFESH